MSRTIAIALLLVLPLQSFGQQLPNVRMQTIHIQGKLVVLMQVRGVLTRLINFAQSQNNQAYLTSPLDLSSLEPHGISIHVKVPPQQQLQNIDLILADTLQAWVEVLDPAMAKKIQTEQLIFHVGYITQDGSFHHHAWQHHPIKK